jgi:hypothetical protein
MQAADVREASARVIAALTAAGRSRITIKRHEAEFNAFARFGEHAVGRSPPRRTVSISSPSGPGSGLWACASRPVVGVRNSRVGRFCC